MAVPQRFDRIDAEITGWMGRHGVLLTRIALGIVFTWFGALKFVPGASPAEGLATRTIERLTFGLVPLGTALMLLALWEVLIGLGFLTGRFLRLTILLLFLQMAGATAPLFLFPDEAFRAFPWAPTLEGQYIIKNVVLMAAAIVVGSTVRGAPAPQPEGA
jgi:uncharacterized membrane protein YkgB